MAKPLVSAGMVANTLEVAPQAAWRFVLDLGLREMSGRGRFRAWGILQAAKGRAELDTKLAVFCWNHSVANGWTHWGN